MSANDSAKRASTERTGSERAGSSGASGRFRLRGEVAGSDRTFALQAGGNVVGRSTESEVYLPARGVSQRHAQLHVGPDRLRLEDLDSKNGSFVNGSRVASADLEPGDRIWFGTVELILERIEELDNRLAFDLDPPRDPISTGDADEATPTRRNWLDGRLVERWFAAIDAFLEPAGRGAALETALGRAAALIGVRAAAVLELGAGHAVALAACGELEESLGKRVEAWLGSAEPSGVRFGSFVEPGSEPVTVAAETGFERPALALALCGDFPARAESERLVTALLRLVCRNHLPAHGASPAGEDGRGTSPVPSDAVFPGLVFPSGYVPGVSAAMRELHHQMEALAGSDLPVLISGETGVGKEWVVRILHGSSTRRNGPFVAINCAAVPAELLEAELFGIGKGVATGVAARPGRFLDAQGGTLFLDEIGDLPAVLQPKLLRALEAREIQPVGEDPMAIDVRILAATNSELEAQLGDRSFRADLYYRLAGAELRIPPLRRRRDDVSALVEHYLRRISAEIGKPVRGITLKALHDLMSYRWPGNVRELVHEVRRLVYVCPENEAIESRHLAAHVRAGSAAGAEAPGAAEPGEIDPGSGDRPRAIEKWFADAESLDLGEIECAALAEALRRSGGNQVKAGRLLGLSRMAVSRRIDRCRERGRPVRGRAGDG